MLYWMQEKGLCSLSRPLTKPKECADLCAILLFLGKHYLSKKNDLHASPLVIVSFELGEMNELIKLH